MQPRREGGRAVGDDPLPEPRRRARDGEASLAALLAALDADPAVAAAAPRLTGDGQALFQLRRLPRAGSILREALLVDRLLPGNAGLRSDRYLDRPRDEAFDVEQPAAAALLVRRADFDAVGGFDPAFFPAWFEDVDLCAKLLERGRRIRYVPAAVATHVGRRHDGRASLAGLPAALRAQPVPLPRAPRLVARPRGGLGRHARGSRSPPRSRARSSRADHARADVAAAQFRVLRGLLGLGWRSALLPGDA